MDFVPEGWLPSFSEAAQLYEVTRFGEQLALVSAFGIERFSRRLALQNAEKNGRPLNEDEEAELRPLNAEYQRIEQMIHERYVETRAELRQKLFAEEIRASIQDQKTGRMVPIPGRYWASKEADTLVKPHPGFSTNTIIAFGGHGPVRICREDVLKAARPTTDPAMSRTSHKKKAAFKAARAFVLTFKGTGKKATQQVAKEHVEKQGHFVADADPEEWWKEFKKDPQTRDCIQGKGRPRQNPENTPR